MKYVILTIEWCVNKGIVVPKNARKSINKSKVILHYDFIEPILTDNEEVAIYNHNSPELNTILNSSEWVLSELDT